MTSRPEYLDPHKWAAMLGLLPTSDPSLQSRDETEKEQLFQQRFYYNTRVHQDTGPAAQSLQLVLWAEFSARYSPALVNRLLDLPPHGARPYAAEDYRIQNIYHTTFKFADIAYLAKFMSSSHPIAEGGKRLPRVVAERLVEFAPNWDRLRIDPTASGIFEGAIHRAVTTLMMLLIAAKDHSIPTTTTNPLVRCLDTWASFASWSPESMTLDNNLPAACVALRRVLTYHVGLKSVMKQQRHALKCIEVCALPSCNVETNLKVCTRCKTAAYCSEAHQKEDWKRAGGAPHKKRCFETDY